MQLIEIPSDVINLVPFIDSFDTSVWAYGKFHLDQKHEKLLEGFLGNAALALALWDVKEKKSYRVSARDIKLILLFCFWCHREQRKKVPGHPTPQSGFSFSPSFSICASARTTARYQPVQFPRTKIFAFDGGRETYEAKGFVGRVNAFCGARTQFAFFLWAEINFPRHRENVLEQASSNNIAKIVFFFRSASFLRAFALHKELELSALPPRFDFFYIQ
jgi:hypothetical protein